MRENICVVVGQ